MVAARFVPSSAAPEREMLLATSPTLAQVPELVEESPPPVKPSQSPAPSVGSASSSKYVVQEGDTLSGISENWFGMRGKWALIVSANPGMDPGRLAIGQVLLLPPKNTALAPEKVEESTKGTFVVRPGDSLSRISLEVYGSANYWDLIYEANAKMIGNDPADLAVGQKLVIPPAPSR